MSEEMNLYKRCKNIFKFHGVDMGGGGESAPEVENAIETHGLGWTDTEEKAGFDIQWDGNTEGLDYITIASADGGFYKISDELYGMSSAEDLIGASIEAILEGGPWRTGLHEGNITTQDNKVFALSSAYCAYVAFEDGTFAFGEDIGTLTFTKGIWSMKSEGDYTTRLYKEATTEEVVHQIDQKYIPGGSGGAMVVTLTVDEKTAKITADKTLQELQPLINSDAMIIAKVTMGDSYSIFWPLVHYEEEEGVPSEAYFGYMTYDSTTDSSKPTLQATLNEYGVTEWTSWYFK